MNNLHPIFAQALKPFAPKQQSDRELLEAICFAKDHHFQHEAINAAIRILRAESDGDGKS